MSAFNPELYKQLFFPKLTLKQKLKQRVAIANEKSLKKKARVLDIEFLNNCLQYLEITDEYTQDSKELLKEKLIQLYYKYAAISGNKSIFEDFKENGYSKYMPEDICSFILKKKNNYEFFIYFFSIEGTKYFNQKLFLYVIHKGYVNILTLLFHNKCPLPERIFEHIANLKNINLGLIKWGLEENLPFYDTFYILCRNGNLEALLLVYQNGCSPDTLSDKKIRSNNSSIRDWIKYCTPFKSLLDETPIESCLDSDWDDSDYTDSEVYGDTGYRLIETLKKI